MRFANVIPGTRTNRFLRQMPSIAEDDDAAAAAAGVGPPVPERSLQRPTSGFKEMPLDYRYYLPPPYSQFSDETAPDRKTELPRQGIRETQWFARRGGWCRLCSIITVLVALIVGLAVGLTIGLHNSQSQGNSSSNGNGGGSGSDSSQLFPAGSYTFTTALANVTTNCTTNADAFSCYPYSVYSPSDPRRSAANFSWIISAVEGPEGPNYVISSSTDPFVPQFSNVSTALLDQGLPTERLSFAVPMDKAVVPAAPLLAGSTVATTCYFNGTVMSATIWTRARASYPEGIVGVTTPVNASTDFAPWPFVVEVAQVQQAGAGVPDCRDSQGNPVGDFAITNNGGGSGDDTCGCWYSNTQLPA